MDQFGTLSSKDRLGKSREKLPVGSVVIRIRGNKSRPYHSRYIKIRDDGPPKNRWKAFARWWWEKNKGPIPAGKLVIHEDGDELNDSPDNLILGTPGTKLVLVHNRDKKWSEAQHARAAAGCGNKNRERGRINRSKSFIKNYWYPVVDSLGVILNVPFRQRKRIFAAFGEDVSRYPKNGHGRRRDSQIQKILSRCAVRPTASSEFSLRRYETYCLLDPDTETARGPMSGTTKQLVDQLDRMGIWEPARKYALKDFQDRK